MGDPFGSLYIRRDLGVTIRIGQIGAGSHRQRRGCYLGIGNGISFGIDDVNRCAPRQ